MKLGLWGSLFWVLFLGVQVWARPRLVGENLPAKSGACLAPSNPLQTIKYPTIEGKADFTKSIHDIYKRISVLRPKPEFRSLLEQVSIAETHALISCGKTALAGGCARGLNLTIARVAADGTPTPPNYGIIAHELGHVIGATGGAQNGAFQNISCLENVSARCTLGHSESFAEAFSSYLTDPEHLRRTCPEAYQFMKDQVFAGPESKCGPITAEDKLLDTEATASARAEVAQKTGQTSLAPEDCPPGDVNAGKNIENLIAVRDKTYENAHAVGEPLRDPKTKSENGSGEVAGMLRASVPVGLSFINMMQQQREANALQMQQQTLPWQFGAWTSNPSTMTPASATPTVPTSPVPSTGR